MSMLKAPITPRDHIRGPANAAVTLVEYGDYQCPHCGMVHPVVTRIEDRFRQTLRFVFRHFPLSQVHPFAESAAEAAEFAGAHGRFWEMHDGLFENLGNLNDARLALPFIFTLAEATGLSPATLRTPFARGDYAPEVRHCFLGGIRSGANGTPTR